jgi:CheY-like chemotaxis protein
MQATPAQVVLLCDPHADSRAVYAAMFRHEGVRVIEAETAVAALEIACREPLTAAVVEMVCTADGCSLTRALSLGVLTAAIPVYVVTSETRPGLLATASEDGAAAVRMKPFRPRDLVRLVLSRGLVGGTHEPTP